MIKFQSKTYQKLFNWLFGLYVLFILVMIYRSSFIGLDGHRYFSLFDDAMISMRYAYNLAHGHGLVWNVGQHVEGFTNPLMVFVMAGAILLFGQNYSVLFIQLLGLGFLVANIFLVYGIAKKIFRGQFAEDLTFYVLLLTMGWYPIIYWAVFGMETGMLTTLILLAVFLEVQNWRGWKPSLLLGIVLGLCYLTRPDSGIFLAALLFFRLVRNVRDLKSFGLLVIEGASAGILGLAYEIFRLRYYHEFYPNTYILKATGMDLLDRVKNGAAYFGPFLQRVELWLFLIGLAFFIILFAGGKSLGKKIADLFIGEHRYLTLFAGLFVVFSAYQIEIGGDPWPPFWRMTVPYTVLLFFALALAADYLRSVFNTRRDLFLALIWFLAFLFLAPVPFDYHYDFLELRPYQTGDNQSNLNAALAIDQLTKPNASMAFFWAGTAPYFSERPGIDPLGKMDPYIARLAPDLSGAISDRGMYSIPGHNKYDLNYSFKQLMPDVIEYLPFRGSYCSWGTQNLQAWCSQNYRLVSYKGVQLLLKNGSNNVLWDKVGSLK